MSHADTPAERFGALRSTLQQPPAHETWRMVRALYTRAAHDDPARASEAWRPYILDHTESWPDELCHATLHDAIALTRGEVTPGVAIARHLDLTDALEQHTRDAITGATLAGLHQPLQNLAGHLRSLTIGHVRLEEPGMRTLFDALDPLLQDAAQLHTLRLGNHAHPLDDAYVKQLSGHDAARLLTAPLPALHTLDLSGHRVGDRLFHQLASGALPALDTLALRHCRLDAPQLRTLCDGPLAAKLRALDLSSNTPHDGRAWMAQCGALPALESLHITHHNAQFQPPLDALAQPDMFPALHTLQTHTYPYNTHLGAALEGAFGQRVRALTLHTRFIDSQATLAEHFARATLPNLRTLRALCALLEPALDRAPWLRGLEALHTTLFLPARDLPRRLFRALSGGALHTLAVYVISRDDAPPLVRPLIESGLLPQLLDLTLPGPPAELERLAAHHLAHPEAFARLERLHLRGRTRNTPPAVQSALLATLGDTPARLQNLALEWAALDLDTTRTLATSPLARQLHTLHAPWMTDAHAEVFVEHLPPGTLRHLRVDDGLSPTMRQLLIEHYDLHTLPFRR